MTALDLARQLQEHFGDSISGPSEFRGEATLVLAEAQRVAEVCRFARHSLGFDFLLDITSVDNYGQEPRWSLVYELYGLTKDEIAVVEGQ